MPNDRTKPRTAFVQLTFNEREGPNAPEGDGTTGGYFNEPGLEVVLASVIKKDEFAANWIKDVKVVLISEGEA
jgi:hypothetical protein